MTDVIDAEVVESTELAVREAASPTLFGTDEPRLIIAKASGVADALKDVIVKQKMAIKIGGNEYVKVEGWTTLGALLGVFPKVEWTRELADGDGVSLGWEAAVVVVNSAGVEIGRAEAQCLRAEKNWKSRDDFALRSMAQTRAMGKALRMPLGWIAVMAGYEATPAEEMPEVVPSDDVPFDESRAAQGQTETHTAGAEHGASGTGGAGAYADEGSVTEFLELAASVSNEAHDKAVDGLAAHRKKNDDRVDAQWLGKMTERLLAKTKASA